MAARRHAETSEARSAQAEAGLALLVLHDALTGLLNRTGLERELDASLLEALAAPVELDGLEVVVSASIGVSLAAADGSTAAADLLPADGGSGGASRVEVLLRRADSAMYVAKSRGRAGWHVHDPERGDPTADRLRLIGQLRHAIEDGQLRLHHQPRIALATSTLDGVEALVRWQHPDLVLRTCRSRPGPSSPSGRGRRYRR